MTPVEEVTTHEFPIPEPGQYSLVARGVATANSDYPNTWELSSRARFTGEEGAIVGIEVLFSKTKEGYV